MNTLTAQIEDLMDNVKAMKKTPGVDTKALNKTLARLEEAWLWSQHVVRVDAAMPSIIPAGHTVIDGGCICPAGAVDQACRIHSVV